MNDERNRIIEKYYERFRSKLPLRHSHMCGACTYCIGQELSRGNATLEEIVEDCTGFDNEGKEVEGSKCLLLKNGSSFEKA